MIKVKVSDSAPVIISPGAVETTKIKVGDYIEESHDRYQGDTRITPAWVPQTLGTAKKFVREDIVVLEIEATETSNESGGLTLAI